MDIPQQIRDVLHGEKDFKMTDSVRDEDGLIESGVLDSFGMITLVVQLEQRFGVKVDPGDVTQEDFRSIRSIANYLEGKLDGGDRG